MGKSKLIIILERQDSVQIFDSSLDFRTFAEWNKSLNGIHMIDSIFHVIYYLCSIACAYLLCASLSKYAPELFTKS